MQIKESFNSAVIELVEGFGISTEFLGEEVESALSSANQVNVLIGLTKGLKGNLLLGMKKSTAVKIASAMIGSEVAELDELSESAISEFMNTLVGMGLGKYEPITPVDFSSPTLIVGESMFLMISRVAAAKLLFKLGDETFCVSISIEQL
jgi:chemotaxis protein CheX